MLWYIPCHVRRMQRKRTNFMVPCTTIYSYSSSYSYSRLLYYTIHQQAAAKAVETQKKAAEKAATAQKEAAAK